MQALSNWSGFPVDEVRLVITLGLCYPLGFFFYRVLSPKHVSLTVRHAFSASVGIALGWICIEWQILLLFGLVGGSYAILLLLPPTKVHRYTMAWAMAYLGVCNFYRFINLSNYAVDFSGPLMIQVTKVTYVAFSLHDGLARKESDLNESQKEQKVYVRPSLLEYMSYTFNFHSLQVGPTCTLREHLSFMDGSYQVQTSATAVHNPRTLPYPYFAVVSKMMYALLSLGVLKGVGMYYSSNLIFDPANMTSSSMPFSILIAELLFYSRYYFIWLLAESINNAAGLGFNGYDESGNAKWDLVKNVGVLDTQLATSTRNAINSWNATMGLWLRRVVYDRVQFFSPPVVTMFVCAWWHGIYPAYYGTFLLIGISIVAGRKCRRLIRPHFQTSRGLKIFYDVVTMLANRIFFDFVSLATIPFMTFEKTIIFWGYWYYIPLIVVCALAFLLPGGKKKASDTNDVSDAATSRRNGKRD